MGNRAVVLFSGGIDSTTTLAIAEAEGLDIYALSFDYGQRHKIELEYARKIAENFDLKKHLVINFDLREISGSALTSDIEVPINSQKAGKQGSGEEKELNIPVTYVPARNTIFLSFALAWAESLNASEIFIGANAVDYSGYPDCRQEFINSYEEMANLATKASVENNIKFKIRAPLIELTKAEIIRKGTELEVDYSLAWSCYDPVSDNITQSTEHKQKHKACGKCDSCILRAKGFKEAGLTDPL